MSSSVFALRQSLFPKILKILWQSEVFAAVFSARMSYLNEIRLMYTEKKEGLKKNLFFLI